MCLDELAACGMAELSAIIVRDQAAGRPRRSTNGLFRAWHRVAVELESTKHTDFSWPEDVPRISAPTVRVGKFHNHLLSRAIAEIRALDLDFILRFGFGILGGEILTVPRHGIWSFHHGDERRFRGRPSGFWELYEGVGVIGGILQRLTEEIDGGIVLRRWDVPVQSSYADSLDEVRFAGVRAPAQICRALAISGPSRLPIRPSGRTAPYNGLPTNTEMILFAGKRLRATIRRVVKRFEDDKWALGVIRRPLDELLETDIWPEPEWFPERPVGFWADPFPLTQSHGNGGRVLLCEEVSSPGAPGQIVTLEVDDDLSILSSQELDLGPDHVSYPCTFDFKGSTYVVPEQAATGQVRIYHLSTDLDIAPVSTVISGVRVSDPTLLVFGGFSWVFGLVNEYELWAWYADSLSGPWVPHCLNPLRISPVGARPAGRFLKIGKRLIRPGQVAVPEYGSGIAFFEVSDLRPESYEEQLLRVVRPRTASRYSRGMHTINGWDGWTLVDGRRTVRSTRAVRRRLRRIITRSTTKNPERGFGCS